MDDPTSPAALSRVTPAVTGAVGGGADLPVVVFHFPVEVEVRAAPATPDVRALVDLVLARLAGDLGAP